MSDTVVEQVVPDRQVMPDSKPVCGANKRNGGGQCQRPAGWGTDHAGFGRCKFHLGSTRNHRLAAFRSEMIDPRRALGVEVDIDPDEALLASVREAAGNVVFWRERASELDQSGRLVVERDADDGSLVARSVVGVNHSGDGAAHISVTLYAEWCDRLVRYSKMALDAGVAERRVRVAEQQGQLFADAVRAILGDPALALTAAQQEAAGPVAFRHLSAIAASSAAA